MILYFEDLMKQQVDLIPEVQIHSEKSVKPKFGWGNADQLRKFLEHNKHDYSPLVWSVPGQSGPSGLIGIYERNVELNLCTVETRTGLLNTARMGDEKSFKKVLEPLWNAIRRRFCFCDISMVEEIPAFQAFPDYVTASAERDSQVIWDVLKVTFTARYNESPSGL